MREINSLICPCCGSYNLQYSENKNFCYQEWRISKAYDSLNVQGAVAYGCRKCSARIYEETREEIIGHSHNPSDLIEDLLPNSRNMYHISECYYYALIEKKFLVFTYNTFEKRLVSDLIKRGVLK